VLSVAVARGGAHASGAALARYNETHVVGAHFPKQLVGRVTRVELRAPPQRIASLTVTADEIITKIADPSRIAAVTRFADDATIEPTAGLAPKAAARISGVDPEHVVALEPDLVFVAHYTLESAVRILAAAGVPVVRLKSTRSFEDVRANVRTTAQALGEEPRGEAEIARMNERLARVAERTTARSRPRVLYYSGGSYTSGSGTLVDEKIREAGGRNVAADAGITGFASVSLDLLVGLDPEIIVVPRFSRNDDAAVQDLRTSPAWRDVAAVRDARVYSIPASSLTSESPEGVRGVEELARLFHPEAFTP